MLSGQVYFLIKPLIHRPSVHSSSYHHLLHDHPSMTFIEVIGSNLLLESSSPSSKILETRSSLIVAIDPFSTVSLPIVIVFRRNQVFLEQQFSHQVLTQYEIQFQVSSTHIPFPKVIECQVSTNYKTNPYH